MEAERRPLRRFLLIEEPHGEIARHATVEVVEAYRSVVPPGAEARAREIFAATHPPHWVTFTSSSTVHNLVAVAGLDALSRTRIASIGPVTSATIRRHGLSVAVEAETYTIDGLVSAIRR